MSNNIVVINNIHEIYEKYNIFPKCMVTWFLRFKLQKSIPTYNAGPGLLDHIQLQCTFTGIR